MWTSHPGKWLLWGPFLAGLPFLAGYFITTDPLLADVEQAAREKLASANAPWAKLSMDGRDAAISGDAESDQAIQAAVDAVTGARGVRLVESRARIVVAPPAPVMKAPTVDQVIVEQGKLTASGTWDQAVAKSLAVKVGSQSFAWPSAPQLAVDGRKMDAQDVRTADGWQLSCHGGSL